MKERKSGYREERDREKRRRDGEKKESGSNGGQRLRWREGKRRRD